MSWWALGASAVGAFAGKGESKGGGTSFQKSSTMETINDPLSFGDRKAQTWYDPSGLFGKNSALNRTLSGDKNGGAGMEDVSVTPTAYKEIEKGLRFGTTGSWAFNNRNIEGMSTEMVRRNDAQISGLAQQQFNLGSALLQPQFQASRTQVSQSLAGRGLGQTSTFANAMTDIAGKQSMAQSSLLSDILKSEQQDALARSQMGSQMEMAGLTSRSQRASNRYSLEGQRLAAEAQMKAARMKSSSDKSAGAGQAVGQVGAAFASRK
jgi:hypothetical protein